MVRDAEDTARNAEQSTANDPGYCLQWSRERASIGSLQPDAATAWKHAMNRHPGDRNPPRGGMCYWTGGSNGYGHIAVSLGGGKIRSSDAGGSGNPATVDLSWPETHWGLTYAGWADNVNDVVIPGVVTPTPEGDDMPQYDHASTGTIAQKIKANEWVAIEWKNVPSGKAFTAGKNTAKLGGRTYTASVHANFEAPTGSTIRIRAVEVSDGETNESNPQTEFTATSGTSYASHDQIGHVADGRAWAIRVSCSQDATLTAADVTVLSW